jgi:hypothetical protein
MMMYVTRTPVMDNPLELLNSKAAKGLMVPYSRT